MNRKLARVLLENFGREDSYTLQRMQVPNEKIRQNFTRNFRWKKAAPCKNLVHCRKIRQSLARVFRPQRPTPWISIEPKNKETDRKICQSLNWFLHDQKWLSPSMSRCAKHKPHNDTKKGARGAKKKTKRTHDQCTRHSNREAVQE